MYEIRDRFECLRSRNCVSDGLGFLPKPLTSMHRRPTIRLELIDFMDSVVPVVFVCIGEFVIDRAVWQQKNRDASVTAHVRYPKVAGVLMKLGRDQLSRRNRI